MIYEGANGIQALDLVGRQLPKDHGRALHAFFRDVAAYLTEKSAHEAMKCYAGPLAGALGHLQQATTWLMEHTPGNPENAGAAATDYMHLFGLVAFGYMWCRVVEVASVKLANGDGDTARMRAKLVTARFFMERMLPETAVRLARIRAGAASVMELPADAF